MATLEDVQILDGKICVKTKELCLILDIAQQTLSDWKAKGCPQETRNYWCIADVLKWRGLVSGSGVNTDEEIKEKNALEQKSIYEARWKKAQAEGLELKNAIANGEYIQKEIIVKELTRLFGILKSSLLMLSRDIGIEVSLKLDVREAKELENKVHNKILDCLNAMSINGLYETIRRKK